MTRARALLLVNRSAGRGRAAEIGRTAESVLRSDADLSVVSEQNPQDAAAAIGVALNHGVDVVIVVGGDGTVHWAVQMLATSDVPLAIVPAGTGNDASTALGLPTNTVDATRNILHLLREGKSRALDLGRTDTGRWWLTILCAGFDSAINERANALPWPHGPRRYDLATAIEAARLRPRAFRLRLDHIAHETPLTSVAVANTSTYGGGSVIAPTASPTDSRFTVVAVDPLARRSLPGLARAVANGQHLHHPAIRTFEASTVSLAAPATVAYADGERIAALPLSMTCVPRALHVLM